MEKDPIKCALWGMIVGNVQSMGILPALQGGEVIANCLEGESPIERLAQLDGEENMEVTEKNGFYYVVLKHCPFAELYKDIPPWGEKAGRLVEAYNKKDDGGGALHPLCLVHKGARNSMKAGIVSLACRSAKTDHTEVAEKSLEKAGLTRDEVMEMIAGKACVYALKKE